LREVILERVGALQRQLVVVVGCPRRIGVPHDEQRSALVVPVHRHDREDAVETRGQEEALARVEVASDEPPAFDVRLHAERLRDARREIEAR
jgi:hypothetical protein